MRRRSLSMLGGLVAVLVAGGWGRHAPAEESPKPPANPAPLPPYDAGKTAAERALNEAAYREHVLVGREHLLHEHLGEWIVLAGGRAFPQNEHGTAVRPAATQEQAVAAAESAVPAARQRFVFRLGEEGEFQQQLGGAEVPHVLGNRFLAQLQRPDVEMRSMGQPIHFVKGEKRVNISATGPDSRPFVRPEVGPVGGIGRADALYVLATGSNGYGVLPPGTAAAASLHLWEIPGSVTIDGAWQKGRCRRARARFRFPGTDLDFVLPVAIWPDRR